MRGSILSILCWVANGTIFFNETFDEPPWDLWIHSTSTGGRQQPISKFKWSAGKNFTDEKLQRGLLTPTKNKYRAISVRFRKPFSNKGVELVIQYSVQHQAFSPDFCGGGYIKLLPSSFKQKTFDGDTPYLIMFGPDYCGKLGEIDTQAKPLHNKLQLLFNHKGRNFDKIKGIRYPSEFQDNFPHLYTLRVKPDNTYEVYVDMKLFESGLLHDDFDFRKGHDVDVYQYDDIGGLGLELWSVNASSVFDNFLICDDFKYAEAKWRSQLKQVFRKGWKRPQKKKRRKSIWENRLFGDPDEDEAAEL